MDAGEYAKATTAANAIIDAAKPDKKAPDFLPRCRATIDALMWRGFAESQLGHLDAAVATFAQAQEVFKDREFQKQVSVVEKRGGPQAAGPLVELDLQFVHLQNLRAVVVLEKLQRAAAEQARGGDAAKQRAATLAEEVRGWIESLRSYAKTAADTRKKLADRFDKGGPSVVGSPHSRALMSPFHPELIAGIAAFELSRLPIQGFPPVAGAEPSPKAVPASPLFDLEGLDSAQRLEKAFVHFDAASKALDEVFKVVFPKGLASAPLDAKRLEADVLLAQVLIARCSALLHKRDIKESQKAVDEVFRIHKEMAALRKVPTAATHPEHLLPLLFATELALIDSEEQFKAGLIDEARAAALKATETLARAAALPLAEDHPQRHDLSRLAAAIESQRAKLDASITITDAAEVAARRIRRAVEATPTEF
jgi:tetratricopeptide (TPR) repeat protein